MKSAISMAKNYMTTGRTINFFFDQHSFSSRLNCTIPIFWMSVELKIMLFQAARDQIHKIQAEQR